MNFYTDVHVTLSDIVISDSSANVSLLVDMALVVYVHATMDSLAAGFIQIVALSLQTISRYKAAARRMEASTWISAAACTECNIPALRTEY